MCVLPLLATAATKTTPLQSKATISKSCTMSVTPLAFGEINPAVSNYANTTISVLCNNGTAYTIGGGAYFPDGSLHMKGAAAGNTDYLTYSLNTDVSFPDSNYLGFNANIVGTGNGLVKTHVLHSRARGFGGKRVAPDNYSDTYTLTLTY